MDERVKELRKALGLTQREFSERIGVKRNTVAQYEMGRNPPNDTVITLICREFRVNEHWLRTGEGEMFLSLSRDEELAAFMGSVMADGSESFRHQLLAALSRLSADQWAVLEAAAWNLVDEMKKTGPQE